MAPSSEVKSIFGKALELTTSERAAYLAQACADDGALRAEVEGLLEALGKAGHFMNRPALAPLEEPAATPTGDEAIGTEIGPYKLLQKLGEGGMGTVFLAEQEQPVNRRVALKIMKAESRSQQVIARFEQERHALALMDHPNIAHVLDAGKTDGAAGPAGAGRPYVVMELVQGVPITRFCDQERLTPRDRLGLFIPVCHAVQHAHQKGVIHRDLKPSNVLIAQYDPGAPGVPKVIDFGVAKAIGRKLSEWTLSTEVGVLVGTLEYMAPEQADLNPSAPGDIDTRSDIYSLGVILYELLTGSTPFTPKGLRDAGLVEMLRLIREVEPPTPSTKLSTSDELPTIAATRRLEPRTLTKLISGELDWIVMKCLEKERGRRYETANALARDIQHYLADEPVMAGPPSTAYRLKKFLRRNRGLVVAASLVFLSLLGGIIGATWGMLSAEAARTSESKRAEGERQAKETAEKRLTQIERGIHILAETFHEIDPQAENREGRPLRAILADRLAQAAAELEGEAVGDPILVAQLQNRLGLALLNLGDDQRAIGLFDKARIANATNLGDSHPDTLKSVNNLALAYRTANQTEKALPLLQENLRLATATLGPNHEQTLNCMNSMAGAYRAIGQLYGAIPLYEECLNGRTSLLDTDHPDTLATMINLGLAYQEAGKRDQAIALLEKAYELTIAHRGPDHHETLRSMSNLAMSYAAAGRRDDAVKLFEQTVHVARNTLGSEHHHTLLAMNNLAGLYNDAGRVEEALPLFLEAAAGLEKRQFRHEYASNIVNNLIGCYERLNQHEQAEAWRTKWLAVVKERSGTDSVAYAAELAALGRRLVRQKKSAEAETPLRESLNTRQKFMPDDWRTFGTQAMLGAALLGQQKYGEAEPLLVHAYSEMKAREGLIPASGKVLLTEILEYLVQLYDATNKPDEADRWKQELDLLKSRNTPDQR